MKRIRRREAHGSKFEIRVIIITENIGFELESCFFIFHMRP